MRILYHHRTRGRDVEGVHIRGVVHALRDLGHEVEILSFPGADPESEDDAVATRARSSGRLARWVTRLPGVCFEAMEIGYNLVTWWRVGRVIARQPPSLIYERYSLFLFASVWLARRQRIPIILEINDSALVERVRPLSLKSLARRIERRCLRDATGLVFISSTFRDQAHAAYGDLAPAVVSPNAVDSARFDPSRFDREALRRERGLEDRVVCGHIGIFARWHGLERFVDAMCQRLEEQPRLALLLVGDGRSLPAIRAQVAARGLSDRVVLPGKVPHAQIASWIACMDYAVLPDSNRYGSPMKLFELMAMRVAVVAPDYAPVAEVIDDGTTGWLFPHGDTSACVQRVLELVPRESERAQLGAAAQAYIARERQWRNNAQALLRLVPTEQMP